MVKKDVKKQISADGGEAKVVNENGKRPGDELDTGDKKRQKNRGLYRQPTVKELNRLQETETLFNSNLFRLQVEEILQEVKLKEKTEKKFGEWFQEFKKYLLTIPENDTEYDLTEQSLSKHLKVKLPVIRELKKTKCVFKFHKFDDVRVVGSYAIGCPINSKLRVDLQITVPADTYTKNDSINYRYHKKRAAYLAFIVSHLNKLDTIEELQYSWSNGNETKPVIDFKPKGKLGKHLSVSINLACEAEAYKLHRFSPERNNLREAWLFSLDNPENNTEVGPPTPYYNGSILTDITAAANQEFLNETLLKSENLKQAVVLLKIWLRQRNLQVSGFIVSMFVAYLVQMKRINNIMSSYQIVRNVWIALKSSEWDKKGITLYKGAEKTPSIEEFHKHFPVVFLDKTGYYNICWQMCRGTYVALRRECTLAVEMLDNTKINSFIPLFMTPVKPLMQFDHILKFKNYSSFKDTVTSKASKGSQVNYGVERLALVTDTVYSLLAKGLGDRADLILQLVEADFSWDVKKTPEKAVKEGYEEKLSFGFILNPETAMNIVEKGPPANLPEAEEFRAFWGDKSELRRFQDGSITETCVWDGDTLAEQRTITRQIVDYLMQLKFDIPPSSLFHIVDQLDSMCTRKQYTGSSRLQCEESSAEALRAFDELRRDLRGLTQLPLDVSAVYGVSPVFSYCAPIPPIRRGEQTNPWRRASTCLLKTIQRPDQSIVLPDYTPVSKAVIELGHSGKWPGDIQAFRCLKAAFHMQIAQRLNQQYSIPTQAYPTHIDVLKNGLVFRLEIAHPKEITLLRREMENGVVKFKESEESVRLQRETVLLPRLRGALHGLHQKHTSFGATACLFKRWLSSHLLLGHFPAALAELLPAAVYLQPQPLHAPAVPTLAFMRVLSLLVNKDWTRDMLVLDFNGDMTREEITELERSYSTREADSPCMIVVTSYDGDRPGEWGRLGPSPPVLARVLTLATTTLNYMQQAMVNDMRDNLLGAFIPSLAGYDVIIRLHPTLVPHAAERLDALPELRPLPDTPAEEVIPIVEFDPVHKYLDELRSAFGEFALFFHDKYGGEVIAVLWKPGVADVKDLQLSDANALKPVSVNGELKYKVNTAALVEDFRILGRGLVKEITVNS